MTEMTEGAGKTTLLRRKAQALPARRKVGLAW